MSRKKFIESHGATCRNWTWSWSFVNHEAKFVIFGTWNIHKDGDRSLILDEAWELSKKGRKQPAYPQALEHIRLVEQEGYTLKTYEMRYSDELVVKDGDGPAKIEGITPNRQLK